MYRNAVWRRDAGQGKAAIDIQSVDTGHEKNEANFGMGEP